MDGFGVQGALRDDAVLRAKLSRVRDRSSSEGASLVEKRARGGDAKDAHAEQCLLRLLRYSLRRMAAFSGGRPRELAELERVDLFLITAAGHMDPYAPGFSPPSPAWREICINYLVDAKLRASKKGTSSRTALP
jgi:hypothetical protein